MDENVDNSTSSIFDSIKQILSEKSETLATYTPETPEQIDKQTESFSLKSGNEVIDKENVFEQSLNNEVQEEETKEWTLGQAPVKTPESPNYERYKEASDAGNKLALIDTSETPENIDTTISLLLRSPEFKDWIGQYALSNDVNNNIESLKNAVIAQKETAIIKPQENDQPIDAGEVDNKFFTGGESYFLDQMLNRLQNSDALTTFFNRLRDQINSEVLEKIDQKENNNNTNTASVVQPENESDALQKVAKLLNEREGEIVEDATTGEKIDELKRMFNSFEYEQARTNELGYNPEDGHPDLEIREYLKAKADWAKQPYYEQGPEPQKPENFEQRLNQPKVDMETRNFKNDQITAPSATENLNRSTSFNILPETTPTELFNLPEPQTQTVNNITNVNSSQEQPVFEPISELPANEVYAEAESFKDENSDKILANTEKTNTALQSLTKLLATFVQTAGTQSQAAQTAALSIPTEAQGAPQSGTSDAILASGNGLIPDIRSKFIYAV